MVQFHGASIQYYVTDLGTLGGISSGDGTTSGVGGINSSGQVVGWASIAFKVSRPFLYDNSTMSDLGTLGGDRGMALDISDNGQIAGRCSIAPYSSPHAFVYNGSTMTDLHILLPVAGGYSYAEGINNDGQVVGMYSDGKGNLDAFLYNGSTMTDIGTLGGTFSAAHGINNSGYVVGSAGTTGDAAFHAFLYNGSTMADLGTLGGTGSSATAISDNGQIAGLSYTNGNTAKHAFLSNGSAMTDLGTLGGTDSWACGVNNSGHVVGFSRINDEDDYGAYPFLYNGSTMTTLNQLLHPTSGWTLSWSTNINDGRYIDINDSGQIAANGRDSIGRGHALLLTPIANVPESSALVIQVTNVADSPYSTGFSAVVDGRHSGTSVGYDSGIDHDLDTSMSPTDITTVVYSNISEHLVDYNYAPEVGGYYRFSLGCENPTETDLFDVPNSLVLSDFIADSSNESLDYEYILSVDTDMDGVYDYIQRGLLSEVWASPDKKFGEWTQDLPAGLDLSNHYYGELTLIAIAVPEPSTIALLISAALAAVCLAGKQRGRKSLI